MVEINNTTRSKINLILVKKVVEFFLKYYKKTSKTISLAFVGDGKMKELNNQYRQKNKTTDVLAFPEGKKEEVFLGEIIINYSQIRRQAKKFSETAEEELIFILMHGLLHLIGYEDSTEKGAQEMKTVGTELVNRFKKENKI